MLANNWIGTAGYVYDAAGNMTNDGTESVSATFDAENRISVATKGGASTNYVYDADGNRVEKSSGSTGTIYWYGAPGIIAESDLTGALKSEYVFFNGRRVARIDAPGNAVHYYVSDALNSTSMVVSAAGVVENESEYYPWGGELQFLNNDPGNHYKFTGKERDSESGLDLMGARYFSNGLGRFVQPDPLYIAAHRLADPQSLNLYSYSRNNPVTLSDPTGLDVSLKCDKAASCNDAVKDFNNRKGAQFKVELGKDGKMHIVKGSEAKNLSKAEQALKSAINDTKNHATINVSADTGQSEFGTHDSRGVNSVDMGNLSKLDAPSNAGGLNSGDALAHEAMDAYYSLSMGEEAADNAAAALYPGLYGPTGNQNTLNAAGTRVVGSTFNQAITNGSGTEQVNIRYVTPIPAIDLFGKSPAARNDVAHDAGSHVEGVTFVPPKQQ